MGNVGNGFTEIQVERTEDLYQKALAAAQNENSSLDEWVAKLIQQETRRRALESPNTSEFVTEERHACSSDAPIQKLEGKQSE